MIYNRRIFNVPEHQTEIESQLVVDSSEALVAEFRRKIFNLKGKAYFEVTPAGMAMLDQIVVTFIPVEVDRRKGG